MSKTEILNDLPNLSPSDRSQIFAQLAELHEAYLLRGNETSPADRQALDAALAEFERDHDPGEPWRNVLQQVRRPRQ
ncbi:MAG: hypothetical protein AAB676_04490 [Verrucomicrobiota bacterium]